MVALLFCLSVCRYCILCLSIDHWAVIFFLYAFMSQNVFCNVSICEYFRAVFIKIIKNLLAQKTSFSWHKSCLRNNHGKQGNRSKIPKFRKNLNNWHFSDFSFPNSIVKLRSTNFSTSEFNRCYNNEIDFRIKDRAKFYLFISSDEEFSLEWKSEIDFENFLLVCKILTIKSTN